MADREFGRSQKWMLGNRKIREHHNEIEVQNFQILFFKSVFNINIFVSYIYYDSEERGEEILF